MADEQVTAPEAEGVPTPEASSEPVAPPATPDAASSAPEAADPDAPAASTEGPDVSPEGTPPVPETPVVETPQAPVAEAPVEGVVDEVPVPGSAPDAPDVPPVEQQVAEAQQGSEAEQPAPQVEQQVAEQAPAAEQPAPPTEPEGPEAQQQAPQAEHHVPTPAEVAPRHADAAAVAGPAATPGSPAEVSSPAPDPTTFGRVSDDGFVLVRTPDGGERVVGSWSPRDADEGLQHYARRYFDLEVRVANLEERLAAGAARPGQVRERAAELKGLLGEAAVVGDLAALERRLDALLERTEAARAEHGARRAAQAAEALAKREAIVAEAEQLAESDRWKATGDRLRELVEEWKTVHGGDRAVAQELWQRLSTARRTFNTRRSAHFAELDKQNAEVRERKEALITQAEALSTSTDWGPTSRAMQDLQAAWKESGRLPRPQEEKLWKRFRKAQDTFFRARQADREQRDAELAGTVAVKEALLAEAEAIDPAAGAGEARRRLRDIQDRWEAAGRVPRGVHARLEERLRAVEERVREAGGGARRPQARRTAGDDLADQLRAAVADLERKAANARARGDEAAATRAEQDLASRRAWLAEAERSLSRLRR